MCSMARLIWPNAVDCHTAYGQVEKPTLRAVTPPPGGTQAQAQVAASSAHPNCATPTQAMTNNYGHNQQTPPK